jgi:hypothetical protein
MKRNMGNADRIIRLLAAIVLGVLSLGNFVSPTVGLLLLAVAGIFLFTSLVGLCPIYSLFGINTARTKKQSKSAFNIINEP